MENIRFQIDLKENTIHAYLSVREQFKGEFPCQRSFFHQGQSSFASINSFHNIDLKVDILLDWFTVSGWPRHRENRENREFGSYFFQTGKTQGILL